MRGRREENIEKMKETDRRKTLKYKQKKNEENEEYGENQITKINIFGSTFHIKNFILLENIA